MHSIIIPTAGRPNLIKLAIESVVPRLAGRRAELIIVDNNTDEGLARSLLEYCKTWGEQLRYVRELSPGLGAARHRGAKESLGDILTFLDDDVLVSESWLIAIQDAFLDPDVAMVGGPSIPKFTGAIPAWFWDFIVPTPYGGWMSSWLSLIDIGQNVDNIDPNYIWGLNFSIRKSVMYGCGGFHPDLVPSEFQRWQGDGETGLTAKVKSKQLRAEYRQEAMLWHTCGQDRLSVDYFKKRAFYQGVCDSYTAIRSGSKPLRNDQTTATRSLLQTTEPRSTRSNLLQRAKSAVGRTIRNRFCPPAAEIPEQSRWALAAQDVKASTDEAYRSGWNFHQHAAASDVAVLDWIRRDNYYDTDIRTLNSSDKFIRHDV